MRGSARARLRLGLLAALLASAGGCDRGAGGKRPTSHPKNTTPTAIRWKGVLMTGDDSITAFDNARKQLKKLWLDAGVKATDVRELSMARAEQKNGVQASSTRALGKALRSLKIKDGDGCLVHLTSHGAPWGFYLRAQNALTPAALDTLLTESCGERPTVVFVSACYSGVFTGNALKRPNRAVFAAARDDRNSFGCGVEDVFTFWDACLIERLPEATSWRALKDGLDACIRTKERATKLRFSYPQAYIGRLVDRTQPPGHGGAP